MKKLLTVMAIMTVAMALSAVSFAQQDQSASPSTQTPTADQQSAQPSSPSQEAPSQGSSSSMQTTEGSSFTGTVVKAGGKYVLKTSDTNYQLDNQKKAKQFVGQQVKVNGSLDSTTSTIHVSDINPTS
jgi:uncharacterized protein YdeI (BOF family)